MFQRKWFVKHRQTYLNGNSIQTILMHTIIPNKRFQSKNYIIISCRILGECPNTYAYTKALGEAVVVEAMKDIPVVIFRPSIVVPTWREPISGWTDNINGPVGLLIGAGKGVIRSMYCNSTGYGDYLPVDFGVSAICVGTWNFIGRK